MYRKFQSKCLRDGTNLDVKHLGEMCRSFWFKVERCCLWLPLKYLHVPDVCGWIAIPHDGLTDLHLSVHHSTCMSIHLFIKVLC